MATIIDYCNVIYKTILYDELDRDKIALFGLKNVEKGNVIVQNMSHSDKATIDDKIS